MKRHTNLVLTVVFLLSVSALQSAAQEVIRSQQVVPGVTHTSYQKPGPYSIHVLEVDLREPSIQFETFRLTKLVRTTTQTSANERPDHRVVGAINADFFSYQTGWPVGNQVMKGKIIHGVPSARSHLGFDSRRRPSIEALSFRGSIILKGGTSLRIDRVNEPRGNQRTILFTAEWDTLITASQDDAVILCRVIGPRWRVNDTLKSVVISRGPLLRLPMAYGEAALLATDQGVKKALESSVRVGDTLAIYLGFAPAMPDLQEVVGGAGRILVDGVYDSTVVIRGERLATDFLTRRHPRTFVGFDRDTTRLFLCTVDGRQELSMGMNFDEVADFLLSIGAWNAINLDGGGSTTMLVEGTIVNSPSDKTGERPVANTLQVISKKRP